MNTYLFTSPKYRPLDLSGVIMPGAKLQFLISGTDTPTDVYADADLNTALTNPVEADADGLFTFIYMDPTVTYRVQLYDENDVLQYDCAVYTPPRDYPGGTVLMFMGTAEQLAVAYPSALWQVCDGTNGTYDLRGKFPIGVSSTIDPGEAVGSVPGSVNTDSAGAHDHGATAGSTTLSESQIPAHKHLMIADAISSTTPTNALQLARETTAGGDTEYNLRGSATAATLLLTAATGGSGSHAHSISEDGAHIHVVETTLPPAVGVWFVMRKYP